MTGNNHGNDQLAVQTPSSEEEYVAYTLEDLGIKFEREKRIDKLNGDTKQYRVADFYLTRLKIYIEYYGLYNSNKERRAAYDEKTDVYFKNSIPLVKILPHELGIIEYALHTKIDRVLNLPKFKKQLKWSRRRYKWNRIRYVLDDGVVWNSAIAYLIAVAILFIDTGLTDQTEGLILLVCFLLILWSLFKIAVSAYWVLVRNH